MAPQNLPSGLNPSHYDLRIEPDLEKGTFEGYVTVEIDVLETTSSITLNVHELGIWSTTLFDEEGILIPLLESRMDSDLQTFTVLLKSSVHSKSRVFLHQTFSGTLRKSEAGFHISYATPGSSPIASTMMEARHARTVFPCFDEPSFKSTFTVTIVAPTHLTCLGNMPAKSEKRISSQKKVVEFERTPPIATYLVAFAIGEFNIIERTDFHIPIRAYAPTNFDIEDCHYMLDIAARALEILERTFDLDCSLSKLDLVAIPGSKSGMENWGLITLTPEALVVGPDDTANIKANAISLMVHELAHQYFGNLVTVKSWDNFWLKEGLAEWADVNTRLEMSDSDPWQEFVAGKLQLALQVDSSKFSHPLELSTSGKEPRFDPITYMKGCAVMRTVATQVGKDIFLKGVKHYLKQHAYDNASPEDFWQALREVSDLDIPAVTKSWTKGVGFPVLTVEQHEAHGIIRLTQTRFLSGGNATKSEDETPHPVFLNVLTTSGISKEVLDQRSGTIKVSLDFYKLNASQTGFYRVAYPPARLRKLGDDICKGILSVEDRIGLVSDTAALAFAGHPNVRTSDLLGFLQHFEDESNFFVWKIITDTLNEISKCLLFENKKIRDAFEHFRKHLVKKRLHSLGTFNKHDDLDEQRFKALMFGNSGGDEIVVKAAMEMFKRFVRGGGGPINANIRAEVFEIVLKRGGKKEVSTFLNSSAPYLRII